MTLIAQGECGIELTPQNLKVLKNPNSLYNKKLKFIKNYSLSSVKNMKGLKLKNGKLQILEGIESNEDGASEEYEPLLNDTRTVPIVAHIIRRNNGTGGISISDLSASIRRVNELYRDVNLKFELCDINYINSDMTYNSTITNSNQFRELDILENNVSRKLNVYFVPKTKNADGSKKNFSWSNFPSRSAREQHIIMTNNQTRNATTFAHEIGHWFYLLHTHSTSNGKELVNGSNCETSGDLVCDTPADPKLSRQVNSSCNYAPASTSPDANGHRYRPDTRNIMSYSRADCRNVFTPGQIYRMQAAYLDMEESRGYTFNACSGVGKRISTYKWSEGWTTAEFYTIGSKTYLMLLKEKGLSGTGKRTKIFRMNNNGTVGALVTEYKWSEGWTSAEFYTIGSKTYLMLLKEKGLSGTGKRAKIFRMNSNGTVGALVKEYKWSEGWTTAEFYKVGTKTYLMLLKEKGLSGTGHRAKIFNVNSNSTIGSLVKEYKWSKGWTTAEFYSVGSKTYLLLLKAKGLSGTGHSAKIIRMNSDGSVGSVIKQYKWTEGWTTAEFYSNGSKTYLFLLKERGLSGSGKRAKIVQMKSNGAIGKRIADYNWTAGWATAQFTKIQNQNYLLLLKAKGLSGSGKRVHIHRINE